MDLERSNQVIAPRIARRNMQIRETTGCLLGLAVNAKADISVEMHR
jgi:hypothetical protein